MKKLPLLSVLVLAMPLSAFAESSPSILIMGSERKLDATGTKTVLTGQARAIIKEGAGQTTITATEIAYTNRLECSGDVTITSAGRTIKAKEITMTFDVSPSVYFLNPAGVVMPNNGSASPSTGTPTGATPAHLSGATPFVLPPKVP